jgi:hypothetical protein
MKGRRQKSESRIQNKKAETAFILPFILTSDSWILTSAFRQFA